MLWRSIMLVPFLLGGAAVGAPALHTDQSFNCGTNSLYLLLRLSNRHTSIAELERVLPDSSQGYYSMYELKSAARASGLRLRGVRLDENDLPPDRPGIAYLNNRGKGHFIVVKPVGNTGRMVQIIEPPYAPTVTDYDRLMNRNDWTGILLKQQPGIHVQKYN